MNNKKIISIILARKNSKGIKNKNLTTVNGKPLLYWSVINSIKSKLIYKTFVSSNSSKILSYAQKLGAETIVRPYKYSKSNTSSEKSLIHAINYLLKIKINFKTIVFIQPTSPIREKKDFDKAIKLFNTKKLDSLFSANKTNDTNFWFIKYKKPHANYDYKNRKMRQNMSQKYLENGSFYIFDKDKFLKEKCRLFGRIGFYLTNKCNSFQIDDPEDIKIINSIFKL